MRVLFTSTFGVAVGPTSRSDVLVVIGGLMYRAESRESGGVTPPISCELY